MNSPLLFSILSIAVLVGLAMLFRRLGMPDNRFIIVSLLLFGILLGLASALLWPGDLGVYINILGTAAGDWVYRAAIGWIGNPNSGQAHFTIPWFFRVPQVYAWISPLAYGAIGLVCQFLYSRMRRAKR